MRPMKWTTRAACVALIAVTLAGVALAVSQGSQSDPLVTLSYLNEKAVPEIMAQVDAKLDELGAAQGSQSGSFVAVEVSKGKTLKLTAGAQILFRSGAMAPSVSLTDVTDGTITGGLTANHLYLATAETTLTAGSASTVLVQGSYSVG